MPRTAVIDFETTGISPYAGDRATEIAIVLMEGERVVDRFQSLMNAGVRLSLFIEQFTGITNGMVRAAPPSAQVMAQAARFVGDAPLVAHNAAFDRRFWQAELARLGPDAGAPGMHSPFACTVLLSRRLYPEAHRFSLGSLAAFHDIEFGGRAHRAMADAEVTAKIWARMLRDLERRWDVYDPPHEFLVRIGRTPKAKLPVAIRRYLDDLPAAAAPIRTLTPALSQRERE